MRAANKALWNRLVLVNAECAVLMHSVTRSSDLGRDADFSLRICSRRVHWRQFGNALRMQITPPQAGSRFRGWAWLSDYSLRRISTGSIRNARTTTGTVASAATARITASVLPFQYFEIGLQRCQTIWLASSGTKAWRWRGTIRAV
jgi:hypothetical protein